MARWKTWLKHAVIAAVLTFLFALVLPPAEAFRLMAWAYLFREIGQQIDRRRRGQPIHVRNATLDAVAPALSAALVWLLVT